MKKYLREKYTGIYGSWYAMKQRCKNPNNLAFKNYGGRGISYPSKWESFVGFQEDMGVNYRKGLTIDRIDTNKNYSKENCRWATRQEQNRNKRKHIRINYQGKKITLAEYADLVGIRFGTLRSRYYRGMPRKKIMATQLLSRWS